MAAKAPVVDDRDECGQGIGADGLEDWRHVAVLPDGVKNLDERPEAHVRIRGPDRVPVGVKEFAKGFA